MSRTVRIDLAYDGGGFHGWQLQPDQRTVQGVLNDEIARLLGREVTTSGAGRTDTGVHALGQTASLGGLSEVEVRRLESTLPRMGPDDVRFTSVREVAPDFHARFSALWRRYEYRLSFEDDLFQRRVRCLVRGPIDRAAMDAACVHLLGKHDFRSFCKTASWREDNTCDVAEARFAWSDAGGVFHVRADRFLHHMVRTLVGTLLEVGRGARDPDEIPAVLAAHDRGKAGIMAPPQGLYLAEVGYPDELMDPGRAPDEDATTRDEDQAGTAGAPNEETP